ncbi:hypothetical protein ACF1A5_12115 [Streptomyces sp. NPDC014864]|uniref:hypothetical protein n=1 Tax=Streptomyces sp. NPDC014864 TaxID=3364924 RepID=UPI0036F8ACD2
MKRNQDDVARLYSPRLRGRPGRLEVWYATLTDPRTGTGVWIHHEVVTPPDGSPGPARAHGWISVFPPGGPPVTERFTADAEPVGAAQTDSEPLDSGQTGAGQIGAGAAGAAGAPGSKQTVSEQDDSGGVYFTSADVHASRARLSGRAGRIRWRLDVHEAGAPLYTFPRWAWERAVLPAAQIVPAPDARFDGFVEVGAERLKLTGATGAVARIAGHGNARRWAWLHAGLGGGDVLEVVAAVARRPGMRLLPPLPLLRLRVGGRDWPADPLLAAPLFKARIGLPEWSVRGRVGRRRLSIVVRQDPGDCVTLGYTDPDGATATCTNSERASAEVVVERRTGSRFEIEHRWTLDHTAHAEVGTRP